MLSVQLDFPIFTIYLTETLVPHHLSQSPGGARQTETLPHQSLLTTANHTCTTIIYNLTNICAYKISTLS